MKRWQLYTPLVSLEIALVLGAAALTMSELKNSDLQAKFFSKIDKEISFSVKPGASDSIRFPETGPYDIRLGYTRIPQVTKSLLHHGYKIDAQAQISPRLNQLIDLGIFPTYHEKTSAGLNILDRSGAVIYQVTRPERNFSSFEAIPRLVVETLLYIENREILDTRYPNKNPAVEWDRLGKAVLEKVIQEVYPEHSAPGGSTLATQLEKYRHAYEGRTRTAKDKFQQMLSASFRAYLDGPVTTERRYKIIQDYINSIPLAALPGYGEVNGLGDGLWAWYGSDVKEVSEILSHPENYQTPEKLPELAKAYKQVLSLFIAHRRPSGFLLVDVRFLDALTNDYLNLLATNGVISDALRDAAQEIDLHLRSTAPAPTPISFLDRKAANAIRTQLLTYLNLPKLYELDHIDLNVESTIDKHTQDTVSEAVRSLREKSAAEKLGLTAERTLDRGDPSKVVYSVTLYEHVDGMNLLRVETDNYDRPFNINEGTKLDLGSTAKLRVTTNYLEIIDALHERYATLSKEELSKELSKATDPLSQWAIRYFQTANDKSLTATLNSAMDRQYSANPGESFFTGGGLHTFHNFKNEDNGRVVNISDAIRNSINLPFIRLIRDIVRYYMAQIPGSPTRVDDSLNDEARKTYLARFADKEGSYFLEQFYQKYKNSLPEEVLPTFLRGMKLTPVKIAAIYRYVLPDENIGKFSEFLASWLPFSTMSQQTVQSLYDKYGPGKFSLQDQGYLAKVHPLELWLVRYLMMHPKPRLKDALEASREERQQVYEWLFKTKYRHAQDKRIRELVEVEAFLEIHRAWKRVGYPFDSLTPSYATAIGSSGDRPAALAELVGIIMNDGIRYPSMKINRLGFAEGTPYETDFIAKKTAGERVLKSEVAARLRTALKDVVENGTARRVSKAYVDLAGNPLAIGGKTGTGDHRYETFSKGGGLLSSRVVSRTATFAFFIGNRFFGVVSAHVHGEEAANYDFTSALAAGLLKALAPSINPLINEGELYRVLNPFAQCVDFGPIPPLAEQFVRELKTDSPRKDMLMSSILSEA